MRVYLYRGEAATIANPSANEEGSMSGNTLLQELIGSRFPAILEAAKTLHAGLQAAYHEAGSPYGDDFDGLHRWLDEERQIRDHERAIERIRENQQMCIDLRRQLRGNCR